MKKNRINIYLIGLKQSLGEIQIGMFLVSIKLKVIFPINGNWVTLV